MKGQEGDLNIRGAVLHLLADAGVSVAVVIAGGIIVLTGWNWIDPAASLLVAVVIVWGTWGLLRESFQLSMGAVPAGIALAEVRTYLESRPEVARVHDLHIWAMSTTENALTVHLVLKVDRHPGDRFLESVATELATRFKIHHPTIQTELGDSAACALEPADTV
jgi:cobalt-zinc-cadmium efflux system protein